MDNLLTVVGIVISLIGLFIGGKFFMKIIGRDDKSINIGDGNDIDHSFNKEKNIFSKKIEK